MIDWITAAFDGSAKTECALNDGPGGSILIDCASGGIDGIQLASAIGAVLSALVALYVGYISIRLSIASEKRQKAEKEAARGAERRSQAERISCWLEKTNGYPLYQFHLHNGSDQPVWEVSVYEPFKKNEVVKFFPVLRPGSEPTIAMNYSSLVEEQAVEVIFRDNGGRTWRRSRFGELELIPYQSASDPTAEPQPEHQPVTPNKGTGDA